MKAEFVNHRDAKAVANVYLHADWLIRQEFMLLPENRGTHLHKAWSHACAAAKMTAKQEAFCARVFDAVTATRVHVGDGWADFFLLGAREAKRAEMAAEAGYR